MIPRTRMIRALATLSLLYGLAMGLQGCDRATSSPAPDPVVPVDTTRPGGTSSGSDTIPTDSLSRGGHFLVKGKTYYLRGGEISGDMIFGPKVNLVVLGAPTVTGSLTFLEGCNVYFDERTYLDISSGRLNILGSDSLPVLLKNHKAGKFWGYGSSPDYSGGIFFSSSANPLSVVRHAMIDSANTGIYSHVDGIEISNTAFKHASGYGAMFAGAVGPLAGFSNDSFAGNKTGAFRLSASQLTRLDGTQKFAPGEPNILVDGNTVGTSGTWPTLPVPFEISGEALLSNASGVVVTIAAGAHLVFDQSAYLDVGTSATLKVAGTVAKPVVMGPAQIGKRWGYGSSDTYSGGIFIDADASPNTTIRHLALDSANTGIYVAVSGVTIDSSVFTNALYQSILYAGLSVPGSLKGNTYSGNGEYSIRLPFNGLTAFDGSGTFTGTKSNVLVVDATLDASGSIPALPVPYEISGEAKVANPSGVVLEIQAGAHFVFQQSAYLDVGTSATLKISGTAANPVLMGPAQTGKTWGYGSSDSYSGGIFIDADASSNTTIKHLFLDSANTGIYVAISGVTIDSSLLFANTFQGIRFVPSAIPGSLKGDAYEANGEYSIRLGFSGLTALDGSGEFVLPNADIYVEPGKITTSGTIPALPVAYLIDGEADMGNTGKAVTVTLAPRSVFKFTKGSYFNVADNAALLAVGTATNPIVMENAVSGVAWGYGTSLTYCGGVFLNSGSSNLTQVSNVTFKGVVNDVPVYIDPSLTGVTISSNTVSPGI